MRPDTASSTDKYSLRNVRIPAFGRVLRRTHLDELPQLLLVPFGLMSLVESRPEMPEVAARYPAEFVAERTSVRPGCTCLWQLSDSADGLIYEAPEYDRAYLRHSGPLLDTWILYRTARRGCPSRARSAWVTCWHGLADRPSRSQTCSSRKAACAPRLGRAWRPRSTDAAFLTEPDRPAAPCDGDVSHR